MKPRPLMWCSVALSGKYVSVKTLAAGLNLQQVCSQQHGVKEQKNEQHFWFKAF